MLVVPLQNGQRVLLVLQSQLAGMVQALVIGEALNGPSAAGHHGLLGLQGGADNQPHLRICPISHFLVQMGRIHLHLMSHGAPLGLITTSDTSHLQNLQLLQHQALLRSTKLLEFQTGFETWHMCCADDRLDISLA